MSHRHAFPLAFLPWHAPVIEPLEGRRLLSGTLDGATVTPIAVSPGPITVVPIGPIGVTLTETAGVAFTAGLGTFTSVAAPASLRASVTWGDGTAASAGTIVPAPATSAAAAVRRLGVTGTHTYAKAGTYPIVVTVTLPPPAGSLAPTKLIATIQSRAVVAAKGLNLNGTITGTYSLAPVAFGQGAYYALTGTGSAGALGPVQATGHVQLPPMDFTGAAAVGRATGTLTLTSIGATPAASGSVTLALTGPIQAGNGPFPSTLTYTITGGTGAFADAVGSGTIDVSMVAGMNKFTFVIHSA